MVSRDSKSRRTFLTSIAGVAALGFGRTISAQSSADAAFVEGTWRGPWYLGMSSGIATMTLTRTASTGWAGTLQLTNNEKFGEETLPLRSVEIRNGMLEFRVVGADGNPMDGKLPIPAHENGPLKGPARYGGYKVRLELMKADPR